MYQFPLNIHEEAIILPRGNVDEDYLTFRHCGVAHIMQHILAISHAVGFIWSLLWDFFKRKGFLQIVKDVS